MDSKGSQLNEPVYHIYELPILPDSIISKECDLEEYEKNRSYFDSWFETFIKNSKNSLYVKNGYWVAFWIDKIKGDENPQFIIKKTFTQIVAYSKNEAIRMKLDKKIGDTYKYTLKGSSWSEIIKRLGRKDN